MEQVQTKMQKQHLEQCTAVRPAEREPADMDEEEEEEEEDKEELAEIRASEVGQRTFARGSLSALQSLSYSKSLSLLQEAERVKRMDSKLKSLQLDGLVDCDDKAARWGNAVPVDYCATLLAYGHMGQSMHGWLQCSSGEELVGSHMQVYRDRQYKEPLRSEAIR